MTIPLSRVSRTRCHVAPHRLAPLAGAAQYPPRPLPGALFIGRRASRLNFSICLRDGRGLELGRGPAACMIDSRVASDAARRPPRGRPPEAGECDELRSGAPKVGRETRMIARPSAASLPRSACATSLFARRCGGDAGRRIFEDETCGSVDSHFESKTFCWLPPERLPTVSAMRFGRMSSDLT